MQVNVLVLRIFSFLLIVFPSQVGDTRTQSLFCMFHGRGQKNIAMLFYSLPLPITHCVLHLIQISFPVKESNLTLAFGVYFARNGHNSSP